MDRTLPCAGRRSALDHVLSEGARPRGPLEEPCCRLRGCRRSGWVVVLGSRQNARDARALFLHQVKEVARASPQLTAERLQAELERITISIASRESRSDLQRARNEADEP